MTQPLTHHSADTVRMVETLYVDELPKKSSWDSQQMVQFTHAVLSRVQRELRKVPELTEMVAQYEPKTQIIAFRKADVKSDHYFLPDQFIERYAR